jgi:hypothetical protein
MKRRFIYRMEHSKRTANSLREYSISTVLSVLLTLGFTGTCTDAGCYSTGSTSTRTTGSTVYSSLHMEIRFSVGTGLVAGTSAKRQGGREFYREVTNG